MKNTFAPADIVIYNLKTRTKVSEPSLIVYDTETLKVLAVGNEAYKMNCTANQICTSPLHFGEIEDFATANVFFKLLIKREFAGKLVKPRLALCIPKLENAVSVKMYQELLSASGARSAEIFSGVTLDEFIAKSSDDELNKFSGIIWITKENIKEYADELIAETNEKLRNWGLSEICLRES